jgi:hypothetical protein
MLPALQEQWAATAVAARSLDRDLSLELEQLIMTALDCLDERSFLERMEGSRPDGLSREGGPQGEGGHT